MKVDRRFRNGLLLTNSYTLSRAMDYADENGGIGTPIDFELSWARVELRSHAQLRADGDLRAALGPGQAVAEQRPAGQDDRRLADQRHLHRAVRHAADHRRQRHAC